VERVAGSQIEVEAGGVEEGATKVRTHKVTQSTQFRRWKQKRVLDDQNGWSLGVWEV